MQQSDNTNHKRYCVPGDRPSPSALVRYYEPMLLACGNEQAALWLTGLESYLERSRQADGDLDNRLSRILSAREGAGSPN